MHLDDKFGLRRFSWERKDHREVRRNQDKQWSRRSWFRFHGTTSGDTNRKEPGGKPPGSHVSPLGTSESVVCPVVDVLGELSCCSHCVSGIGVGCGHRLVELIASCAGELKEVVDVLVIYSERFGKRLQSYTMMSLFALRSVSLDPERQKSALEDRRVCES